MDKITCIIVDDEENSRKVLRNLLTKFCLNVEIVGDAEDVESAYKLIAKVKPQLVFLDIQMPTENGFNLLKKYTELPFEVIFVTSYDRFAINAIKFSALDYLLKPVEVKDIVDAVNKATKKINKKEPGQVQIINFLNNLKEGGVEKNISIHQNEKVIVVKIKNIIYIEADGRYAKVTTNEHEKYTIAKTLKEFEEFLADNKEFIRISKTLLINLNYVKDYSKGEPCIIEMQDGRNIEVSRRKKQEFLGKLKK